LTHTLSSLARLRIRITQLQSDRHAVTLGMALVAAYLIVGKLAGAAKEMAVAYRYGVGIEVDAYLNVFNLILWPVGIWLSVISSVLVPLVAQIKHHASAELPQFRAELLGLTLLLGPALALAAWWFIPRLLQSSHFGLPLAVMGLSVTMIEPLLIVLPLGLVISLFSVWLLAQGRHINTLLEGVPAFVICVAISFSFDATSATSPLVWGTVLGFLVHLLLLWLCLQRERSVDRPRFSQRSPYWATFWQGFGVSVIGQMIMGLMTIVDQYFAAQLGAGTLATLSYANRILALILGLGATAVSRATLPVFSAVAAQGQTPTIQIAKRWVGVLGIMGLIGFAFSWYFAPTIVRALFERGAFNSTDTLAVAEVLRYGLVQVPVFFPSLVLVSFLSSTKQYKLIAIGATLNLIVKVAANYLLVPQMGINGIISATSVMYAFSFLFLWFSSLLFVRRAGVCG
jgi:putative peptidoglycan lipid II flippase